MGIVYREEELTLHFSSLCFFRWVRNIGLYTGGGKLASGIVNRHNGYNLACIGSRYCSLKKRVLTILSTAEPLIQAVKPSKVREENCQLHVK